MKDLLCLLADAVWLAAAAACGREAWRKDDIGFGAAAALALAVFLAHSVFLAPGRVRRKG